MDSGASGNSGLNAQELVVVEFKHVLARAQDPVPPTVEKIVSGAEMRQGHVVLTLAQVKWNNNTFYQYNSGVKFYKSQPSNWFEIIKASLH